MNARILPRERSTLAEEEKTLRIKIDLALCQGHGQCAEEAPEVFRVVNNPTAYDHAELIMESPDEALRPKVERAIRYCPNRVISFEG